MRKSRATKRKVKQSTVVHTNITVLDGYKGIAVGDEIRVEGFFGRYRVGRVYRDKGGVCFDITGVSRGSLVSRTIDPDRRKVVKQ